ncbi:MAG TPA: hypothetical protein VFE51_06185 [Verrucomicrobiae bacterium]|nr:hypothetical protein [Verrucomicrobiae bacterium]
MKIKTSNRDQDGMAVIVVIAFLSILLIFVAGNLRMLHLLRNDLKLIEQQQTNRLAVAGIVTNAPAPGSTQPGAGHSE